jgi:hypothetical protein
VTTSSGSSTPSTPSSDRIAELRRIVREWRKQQRLDRLARGLGRPRTQREMRVWLEGVQRRFGLGDEGGEQGDEGA